MGRRTVTHTALIAVAVLAAVVSASCARTPAPDPTPGPSATATVTPTPPSTTAPPTTAPPTTAPPTPPTSATPTTAPSVVPTVPASLKGKDIESIPTTARIVALTFDAGANDDGLRAILATLDSENVPATFFITGTFATRYPASVQAIVAGGHRLGNHTATHPHLPALSDAAIVGQVAQAEAQIRAAGGTDPRPLFRFPFGDRNAHVIKVVNDAGYVAVRWTVDTLGWKGTELGGITAQIVVDRVVAGARPGEIVLMHVGSNPDDHTTLDADALPAVIARLRALGYAFVTLDTLLSQA